MLTYNVIKRLTNYRLKRKKKKNIRIHKTGMSMCLRNDELKNKKLVKNYREQYHMRFA